MNDFHVIDVPDIRRGSESIMSGTDCVFVHFDNPINHQFDVFTSIEHTGVGVPPTPGVVITNKTCYGFTAYLSGAVNDPYYKLNWRLELY